jgi:hypothetical protein
MSLALGQFSSAAAARARELNTGLPLASLASPRKTVDKEVDVLVRRLAARGLLEFRLICRLLAQCFTGVVIFRGDAELFY